jgi:hypothetical protein
MLSCRPLLSLNRAAEGSQAWAGQLDGSGHGIFISYRRQENNYFAGRLSDRLTDSFGADRLFIDVDTIRPGVDFTQAIRRPFPYDLLNTAHDAGSRVTE